VITIQVGCWPSAPGDRSGEAGVKAVERIDAGRNAGRHTVRDAADRTWQTRKEIRRGTYVTHRHAWSSRDSGDVGLAYWVHAQFRFSR
jgi:hypothetical protein